MLVFLSLKEEVEMDEPISDLPKEEEGELLTINGDPEVGEPCMFLKVCFFLCFIVCVIIRKDI